MSSSKEESSSSRHDRRRNSYHRSDRDRYYERDHDSYARSQRSSHLSTQPEPSRSQTLTPEEQIEARSRTVFVSHIHPRATERQLRRFFEDKGISVVSASLVTDKGSRKSKGIGYVEFATTSGVDQAVLLTGTSLEGFHITIQRVGLDGIAIPTPVISQTTASITSAPVVASPTPLSSTSVSEAFISSSIVPTRVIAGNLPSIISEDEIRTLFSMFGPIVSITLYKLGTSAKDSHSKSQKKERKKSSEKKSEEEKIHSDDESESDIREYSHNDAPISAVIEFSTFDSASAAAKVMDGIDLINKITVTLDSDTTRNGYSQSVQMLPTATVTTSDPHSTLAANESTDSTKNTSETDKNMEEEAKNMFPVSDEPTLLLLLKNLYDPKIADESSMKDICSEVREESQNFGEVVECILAPMVSGVLITFSESSAAEKAFPVMNGRWFDGRRISAQFVKL